LDGPGIRAIAAEGLGRYALANNRRMKAANKLALIFFTTFVAYFLGGPGPDNH
jgi:hypothetical protein